MVTCGETAGETKCNTKPNRPEAGVNECILYTCEAIPGTGPRTGPLAGGALDCMSRPASGYRATRVHNTYLLTYHRAYRGPMKG